MFRPSLPPSRNRTIRYRSPIVDAVTTLLGVDDQIGTAERDALIDYLTDGAGPSASVDLNDSTLRDRKLNGLVATVLQSPIYQLH